MQRFCLTLDLKNDPHLIEEYEIYHQKIWPEIEQSILESGILDMQIFRLNTRMFMIIDAEDSFTFEAKSFADQNNPKVKEWEDLMWKYQQSLPEAKNGEKWMLMKNIFSLK